MSGETFPQKVGMSLCFEEFYAIDRTVLTCPIVFCRNLTECTSDCDEAQNEEKSQRVSAISTNTSARSDGPIMVRNLLLLIACTYGTAP